MGHLGDYGPTCGSCGGMGCIPGRRPCEAPYCPPQGFIGRFCANLYECLCCPDPCYQPTWVPEANASFFADYARPRTITRLRYDHGWGMQFPDRSEYFMAQEAVMIPNATAPRLKNSGGRGLPLPPPAFAQKHQMQKSFAYKGVPGLINWNQLYLYQEIATQRASFFIEIPYRTFDYLTGPSHSGFSDLNLGGKSLWVDCELLQVAFQFKTYIPTASPSQGLGTGHTTLEPSLLASLRLAPETYLQGQIIEWIPLGGDQGYMGTMFNTHFSLNQVLFRPYPTSPLIGTLEFSSYSFQGGAYTSPIAGPFQKSSGETYAMVGPGLRQSICNNVDCGGALAFPITDHHWASTQLRLELRVLY